MKHKILALLLIIVLILPYTGLAKNEAEFNAQFAALKSPIELMLSTKNANVRVGDAFYLPFIEERIIPTDEMHSYQSKYDGSATSDNTDVAQIDENGLITIIGNGVANIEYNTQILKLNVNEENQPFSIQNFIYLANYEYLSNQMQRMPKYNKYAKWYYKKKNEVGWCSVFASYITNAAGLPTFKHDTIDLTALSENKVFGLLEGQVGSQWDGYKSVDRFTNIPKPGYLVIYGNRKNGYKHTHIWIVVEAKELENGNYLIRTVEGNMSNTVKSYIYIYDSNVSHPNANMSETPEEFRENPLPQYTLHTNFWSVFGFCATW